MLGREQLAQQVLKLEQKRLDEQLQHFLPVTEGKKTVLCIGRILRYFHPGNILQTISFALESYRHYSLGFL